MVSVVCVSGLGEVALQFSEHTKSGFRTHKNTILTFEPPKLIEVAESEACVVHHAHYNRPMRNSCYCGSDLLNV